MVGRLQELREQVLETLRNSSVRFYSTSLLIVCEGCLQTNTGLSSDDDDDDDDDYEDDEGLDDDDIDVLTMDDNNKKRYNLKKKKLYCGQNHDHHDGNNPGFDIRIIDFAHTCFSSSSSTDGFVHGLDNLIKLLDNIRRESTNINNRRNRKSFGRNLSRDSSTSNSLLLYDSGTESRME